MAVFEAKLGLQKLQRQPKLQTFLYPKKNFSSFYFASPKIIEAEVRNRQTDRQILWHHVWVGVDFFFKLNLLPPFTLRSQGDKTNNWKFFGVLSILKEKFCFVKRRLMKSKCVFSFNFISISISVLYFVFYINNYWVFYHFCFITFLPSDELLADCSVKWPWWPSLPSIHHAMPPPSVKSKPKHSLFMQLILCLNQLWII